MKRAKRANKATKTLPQNIVKRTVINDKMNNDKIVCPVIKTIKAMRGSKLK